ELRRIAPSVQLSPPEGRQLHDRRLEPPLTGLSRQSSGLLGKGPRWSSWPLPRPSRRAEVGWAVISLVQMSTWGSTTAVPAARAGTVEVLVGLLAELDQATESGVFYDRVCQAVVTLTSM